MANGIIKHDTTKHDLLSFLHLACFSPTKRTWIDAISNSFFTTWPGLTTKAVHRYLIEPPSTSKGHMDQTQKNQQSTKPTFRENIVCCAAFPPPTGKTYSDQTGAFPVTSLAGNKYIFLFYDFDGNYIKPIAIPSRTSLSITKAFIEATDMLYEAGLQPKLHLLDNEASKMLKDEI